MQTLATALLICGASLAYPAYASIDQESGRPTSGATTTTTGTRPQQPQSGGQIPASQPAAAPSTKPDQETGGAGQSGSQSASQPVQPAVPRVTDAYNLAYPDQKDPDHKTAAIDDLVLVKVEGLQTLLNLARCVNEKNEKQLNCQEQAITLFLEGRKLSGMLLEGFDVNTNTIQFHIRRGRDNQEDWSDLLGDPPLDERFFERPVTLSVGLENGSPLDTTVRDFKLVRVSKFWFWVGLAGILVLLVAMFRLAAKSDIIRDAGQPPKNAQGQPLPKAFSLARFQMAFWFVLVISSFSFIWLITGALDILNVSVLALIGIGSGTALGSVAVDASKEHVAAPSDGFFMDILSDATGICFYRFQMFVWTLVLGVIFLSSVWYSLSMPEFSATLLALQGISAGTYLGFKIPEKPMAPTTPGSGNGAAGPPATPAEPGATG